MTRILNDWREVEQELRRMLREKLVTFISLYENIQRVVGEMEPGQRQFSREVVEAVHALQDFCDDYDVLVAVKITKEGKVSILLQDRFDISLLDDPQFKEFLREHEINPSE